MLGGKWGAGFAFGLIIGVFLALFVGFWGQPAFDKLICLAGGDCSRYAADVTGENGSKWWWLLKQLVATEDTLAQWAMAFLSLAAVVLLWFTLQATRDTLKATQEMVVDTKAIGQAQTRAYVSIGETSVEINEIGATIELIIRNRGHSPAKGLRFAGVACHSPFPETPSKAAKFTQLRSAHPAASTLDLGPDETFHVSFEIPNGQDSSDVADDTSNGIENFGYNVSIVASYRDIYKRRRKTIFFGWMNNRLYARGERRLRTGSKHNRST